MGKVLGADLAPPSPSAFDGVRPAAVRALGEAALPQVKIFYDTSLEYGAQYAAGARHLLHRGSRARSGSSSRSPGRSPSVPPGRPLRCAPSPTELDALEGRHPRRVPAARLDRQARRVHRSELDAEGGARARCRGPPLRRAAALSAGGAAPGRSSKRRSAPVRRGRAPGVRRAPVRRRRRSLDRPPLPRIRAGRSRGAAAGAVPERASVIASDVLPRYFAALEPAQPAAPRPAARVTVTLVRWPYT